MAEHFCYIAIKTGVMIHVVQSMATAKQPRFMANILKISSKHHAWPLFQTTAPDLSFNIIYVRLAFFTTIAMRNAGSVGIMLKSQEMEFHTWNLLNSNPDNADTNCCFLQNKTLHCFFYVKFCCR